MNYFYLYAENLHIPSACFGIFICILLFVGIDLIIRLCIIFFGYSLFKCDEYKFLIRRFISLHKNKTNFPVCLFRLKSWLASSRTLGFISPKEYDILIAYTKKLVSDINVRFDCAVNMDCSSCSDDHCIYHSL